MGLVSSFSAIETSPLRHVDRGFGALRFVVRPSAIRTPGAPRRCRSGIWRRSRWPLLEPASVAPRLVQDRLQSFQQRVGLAALLLIWLLQNILNINAGDKYRILIVDYRVDEEPVPIHQDECGLIQ